MKTPIRTVLLACLALAPAGLTAQNAPEKSGSGVIHVDIEFAGGNLEALLDRLRRQGEDGINIVSSALANKVQMPSLSLKNADVLSALTAIGQIAPQPYVVRVAQQARAGSDVFTVMVQENVNPQPGQVMQPESISVFSLLTITDGRQSPEGVDLPRLQVQTVLSAIDTGLGTSQDEDATVRFHKESCLLFVRGTRAQVNLVSQVLTQLENDIQRRRAETMEAYRAAKGQSEKKSGGGNDD